MSSDTINPKIALIGAGPVSLTLANLLQNHTIPFTIYEAANELRSQGGTLDLHPKAGQLALKEAGLWEAFKANSRPEADCLKLVELTGEVRWDQNGTDKLKEKEGDDKFDNRPEIDRKKLVEILAENVDKGNVKFGKKLTKTVSSASDPRKYDLQFADGTQETGFDLVVGCDGAWSKIRPLVSDTKPLYSGITLIALEAFDVEEKNPWLAEYVGAGSMFSFGEGRAIQSQRVGDGSILTYASLRVPENFLETCTIDWSLGKQAIQQFLDQYFSDIADDLKRICLESTDSIVPRPLYELPVDYSWTSRPGVTLAGDAAHVMTPFAGVGVNAGMLDAYMLGKQITAAISGEKTLDEAVQEYEKELFPTMKSFALKTAKGKQRHFSATGTSNMANVLRAFHSGMPHEEIMKKYNW